eukprot:917664-Amorphochlora_amoeboformis.AAC.1
MTTRKRPIDENRTRKGPIKKRGRGRPKKKPTSNLKLNPTFTFDCLSEPFFNTQADEVVRISADGIGGDKSSKLNGSVGSAGKKRGRGRPKKKALPSTTEVGGVDNVEIFSEASVVSRGKALTQTVSKSSAVQKGKAKLTVPKGPRVSHVPMSTYLCTCTHIRMPLRCRPVPTDPPRWTLRRY